MLKRTRKLEVLALRGRPKGHKTEKNATKLEGFVVGLLKTSRKHKTTRFFRFETLRPEGDKTEKNTTKLEVCVVGLLKAAQSTPEHP